MKKYTPSIDNNNKLKDETLMALKTLAYRLTKGRHNKNISTEQIESFVKTLELEIEALENAFGTGKENIQRACQTIFKTIEKVKKEAMQSLATRLEESIDELAVDIELLKDIINGNAVDFSEDIQQQRKLNWSTKKLHEKLTQLRSIKEECSIQETRLDADIAKVEKEIEELENRMIEEDNERILNDLYRRISSSKQKAQTLDARRNNYSVCFNFLDMIEANVNEILLSSAYSGNELVKAKTMLNMDKIREAIANPEQVIPILKVLRDDIKSINEKVKSMDKRLFEINNTDKQINEDALSYKQMLLQKKREKEMLKEDKETLNQAAITKTMEEQEEPQAIINKKEI